MGEIKIWRQHTGANISITNATLMVMQKEAIMSKPTTIEREGNDQAPPHKDIGREDKN